MTVHEYDAELRAFNQHLRSVIGVHGVQVDDQVLDIQPTCSAITAGVDRGPSPGRRSGGGAGERAGARSRPALRGRG